MWITLWIRSAFMLQWDRGNIRHQAQIKWVVSLMIADVTHKPRMLITSQDAWIFRGKNSTPWNTIRRNFPCSAPWGIRSIKQGLCSANAANIGDCQYVI